MASKNAVPTLSARMAPQLAEENIPVSAPPVAETSPQGVDAEEKSAVASPRIASPAMLGKDAEEYISVASPPNMLAAGAREKLTFS